MRKLKLDLDQLNVESFEPAPSRHGEGTVVGHVSARTAECGGECNTGALGYTCNGCATEPGVCGGPYGGGTKGEECTYADTMNPVLAMCYSMAYCAPTDPRICPE